MFDEDLPEQPLPQNTWFGNDDGKVNGWIILSCIGGPLILLVFIAAAAASCSH